MKPFVCGFCFQSFSVTKDLETHVYTLHKDQLEAEVHAESSSDYQSLKSNSNETANFVNIKVESSVDEDDEEIKSEAQIKKEVHESPEKVQEGVDPLDEDENEEDLSYNEGEEYSEDYDIEYSEDHEDHPEEYHEIAAKEEMELELSPDEITLVYYEIVNGQIQCIACKREFGNTEYCYRHYLRIHAEPKYPCPVCHKLFPLEKSVKYHMKMHDETKKTAHKCHICVRYYRNRKSLLGHLRLQHKSKDWACDHCDLRFAKESLLKKHAKYHTDELKFPCQYCTHVGQTRTKQWTHMIKNHYDLMAPHIENQMMTVSRKDSICVLCGYQNQRRDVQYHLFYKVCIEKKAHKT